MIPPAETEEGRPMTNLLGIVRRHPAPEPWSEGEKIPWHDPDFSRRMLREHLSQDHDAASRRFEIVDEHVDWIHHAVLDGQPTRILDLGCGPGLYTSRLARHGHTCVGIDFAPASIAYARERAEEGGLDCTYVHADIREADYGAGFGLVMFIYGEFNVFRSGDARTILEKARTALAPGGVLLLEPHTFAAVRRQGKLPATWYSSAGGLFSDQPHLCLEESFWDDEGRVATARYFIIDASTGDVTRYASSMQAYTDEEYQSLLAECGFIGVEFHASLSGSPQAQGDLLVIVAEKSAG